MTLRGHLRHLRGRAPSEVILELRDEVAANPGCWPSHLALGRALAAAGRDEEAVLTLRETIRRNRGAWKAQRCLSEVLLRLKQPDLAEDAARTALSIRPDDALALALLGLALLERNRPGEALRALDKAVAISPRNAACLAALGRALKASGRPARAARALRQASEINPADARIRCHLAGAYEALRRPRRALAAYDAALALDPELAEAQFGRGSLLLRLGRYREGWPGYEWRLKLDRMARRARYLTRHGRRRWRGEEFGGRALLVTTEQGSGDIFQFVRFLPRVKARGGTVRLICRPEHRRLLERLEGVDEILDSRPDGDQDDLRVSLLSLPGILGIEAADLSGSVPYLHADPGLVRHWRSLIPETGEPRIGLVWAGNPQMAEDHRRSLRFSDLAPILRAPNVRFFCLQKKTDENEETLRREGVVPLGPHLHDFADTAAAIANLDLVISVDTSVAHLAGAMGARVWTLIRVHPDWRWPVRAATTPWYPSMTLFHQRGTRDWSATLREVADRLLNESGALRRNVGQ